MGWWCRPQPVSSLTSGESRVVPSAGRAAAGLLSRGPSLRSQAHVNTNTQIAAATLMIPPGLLKEGLYAPQPRSPRVNVVKLVAAQPAATPHHVRQSESGHDQQQYDCRQTH